MKPHTLLSLIALLTFPLLAAYQGWVFSKLWIWFVASAFGLPVLGVAHSAGIIVLVNYITSHFRYQKPALDDEEKLQRLAAAYAGSFVTPTIALILGAIINQVR